MSFDLKKYLAEGKLNEEQMDVETAGKDTSYDVKLLLLDLRNTLDDFDNERLTAQEFRDEIATILWTSRQYKSR
jgi:hypothetical protein